MAGVKLFQGFLLCFSAIGASLWEFGWALSFTWIHMHCLLPRCYVKSPLPEWGWRHTLLCWNVNGAHSARQELYTWPPQGLPGPTSPHTAPRWLLTSTIGASCRQFCKHKCRRGRSFIQCIPWILFACGNRWHQFDLVQKDTFYCFKNENPNDKKYRYAYSIDRKIFKCLCSRIINSPVRKYLHIW